MVDSGEVDQEMLRTLATTALVPSVKSSQDPVGDQAWLTLDDLVSDSVSAAPPESTRVPESIRSPDQSGVHSAAPATERSPMIRVAAKR